MCHKCSKGHHQWECQEPIHWRYVSTICLAVSCGDIPLHSSYIGFFPIFIGSCFMAMELSGFLDLTALETLETAPSSILLLFIYIHICINIYIYIYVYIYIYMYKFNHISVRWLGNSK